MTATAAPGTDGAAAAPRAGLGDLAAVTAVVLWGIGPVMVKHLALPPTTIVALRLWIGVVFFAAVLRARGLRVTRATVRRSVAGGLTFAANILLFFAAVKLTTVTDASIISALQPVLLLLVAGPVFGERVTRPELVYGAVSIAGVGLVVSGHGTTTAAPHRLAGDAFAVGALLTWAWYFVASKRARRHLGALEYQTSLLLVAAVAVTPIALAVPGAKIPTTPQAGWLLLIALGPGGGHLLMNWAHAHVRLSVASLLTLASPAISAAGAALFLSEPVAGVQVAGIVVVLGALALMMRPRQPIAIARTDDELATGT